MDFPTRLNKFLVEVAPLRKKIRFNDEADAVGVSTSSNTGCSTAKASPHVVGNLSDLPHFNGDVGNLCAQTKYACWFFSLGKHLQCNAVESSSHAPNFHYSRIIRNPSFVSPISDILTTLIPRNLRTAPSILKRRERGVSTYRFIC